MRAGRTSVRSFIPAPSVVQRGRWINKLTVHGVSEGERQAAVGISCAQNGPRDGERTPRRTSPLTAAQSLLRLNLFTIGSFSELHFGPRRISGCYRAADA